VEPESISTPTENGDGWSRATLRIFGDALQPDEVGVALKIEASHAHLKGQERSRGRGTWSESAWLLASPLAKKRGLDEHIRWLLERLDDKVEIVRELGRKYRIDIFCGFSSGSGQGGFTLDGATLERLAKLGVPLALDLYPPPPADDGVDEGQP